MKILYVATDQRVPGRTGGSVHVQEVASGLAKRGHDVHVVALSGGAGDGDQPDTFELHPSPMLFEHRMFRWSARRGVGALLDRLEADALMERYYNFAGEGVRAAYERGVPALLEVNAPLKEPPGSLKRTLDRLALVEPMAKLRDEQCRKASGLVTPLESIVPEHVPAEKVHRVNWGANVDRFHPDVEKKPLPIPSGSIVVAFAGSFRPWHGADVLVRAAASVPDAFFLFLGDGPALEDAKALATELGVHERTLFTGAVPYAEMPRYLKWAHIGVAPYQPSRLHQMKLGFFWSPLKIFEYMAMAIPVVALDTPPLREILRPSEGLLVEETDQAGWVEALRTLIDDVDRCQAMGREGRKRVTAHYSWERHCEELERILCGLVTAGKSG